MAILLNRFRNLILYSSRCLRLHVLAYSRPVPFVQYYRTAVQTPINENVIENLREKFFCSENIARNIYNKFPSLRCDAVINNDSLEFLRSIVSPVSIFENPLLATMDVDTLKKKIDLLNKIHPKNLDDFLPLLTLNTDKLKKLVAGLSKKYEFEQTHRIYYLSERLKVEPKLISMSLINGCYDISFSTIRNFKRKIDILLDYGVNSTELTNGLYVLGCDAGRLIRRCERMLAIGMPVKMWHFLLAENDFDDTIQKYKLDRATNKTTLSPEMVDLLKKRNSEKSIIVSTLKSLLMCNDIDASELYYNYVNYCIELDEVKRNVEELLKIPIKRKTIKENGFLLIMPVDEIREKLELVKQMQPKQIDDFVPLLIADDTVLMKYKCSLERGKSTGNDHPIYYFSEKLDMPASAVATHFARKTDVFFKLKSDNLKSKLDVLLKHNVERSTILSFKSTFLYSVERIEQKINNLKSSGLDNITSWKIFTSNSFVLNVHRKRHMEEMKSLEGFKNSIDYLAHRLEWSETDRMNALNRYPKLKNRSATKIKRHLDYLLNELKLSPKDITSSLYILLKNLDVIILRVNEMNKIGAPIKIGVISRSKANYLNAIRHYCRTKVGGKNGEEAFSKIEARIKQ